VSVNEEFSTVRCSSPEAYQTPHAPGHPWPATMSRDNAEVLLRPPTESVLDTSLHSQRHESIDSDHLLGHRASFLNPSLSSPTSLRHQRRHLPADASANPGRSPQFITTIISYTIFIQPIDYTFVLYYSISQNNGLQNMSQKLIELIPLFVLIGIFVPVGIWACWVQKKEKRGNEDMV
jgi:hypothetical protein